MTTNDRQLHPYEWDQNDQNGIKHLPIGAGFRNHPPYVYRCVLGACFTEWDVQRFLKSGCKSFVASSSSVMSHLMYVDSCYPLVNIQKAIENGHRNSGFSH